MALLTCQEALQTVAEQMQALPLPLRTERLPLAAALGRVLAEPVFADRDQPPFARSTRDGFAVRAADLPQGARVIGAIRAGEQWEGVPLQPGEAIEIMTGAPVPAGADAVVMVEHVTLSEGTLKVQTGRTLRTGENIVPRGAESAQGAQLLRAGTRISTAEIALAASVGAAKLSVYARPAVAIVATGDELVSLDIEPGPMQIRNSNSYALAALVTHHGGEPLVLPPAADTRESLEGAIAAAREAPLLLLSGGVSAGKYDFVEDALLARGAEFFFTGVAMQPGKPAVFGRIPPDGTHPEQWIFGLPGNPVSTQVTALLFAMPLLRALTGERDGNGNGNPPQPRFAEARLLEQVDVKPGLTRFLPARLESSLAGATVQPTGWQGSGDLHSNARANCYLVIPPDVEELASGTGATVLLRGA